MAARESSRIRDCRSVPSGAKSFSPRLGRVGSLLRLVGWVRYGFVYGWGVCGGGSYLLLTTASPAGAALRKHPQEAEVLRFIGQVNLFPVVARVGVF